MHLLTLIVIPDRFHFIHHVMYHFYVVHQIITVHKEIRSLYGKTYTAGYEPDSPIPDGGVCPEPWRTTKYKSVECLVFTI
jgi:hypothetical protein